MLVLVGIVLVVQLEDLVVELVDILKFVGLDKSIVLDEALEDLASPSSYIFTQNRLLSELLDCIWTLIWQELGSMLLNKLLFLFLKLLPSFLTLFEVFLVAIWADSLENLTPFHLLISLLQLLLLVHSLIHVELV